MKRLSKKEAERQIREFFLNIKDKTPREVKRMKKFAMRYNIHLKKLRKTFCDKCFFPYKAPSIRVKNRIISITCGNCGHISRWKIKD